MKRNFHFFASFVLTLNIAALSLCIYWLTIPYPTADMVVPIEILNENHEIHVGDKIVMRMVLDKQANIRPQADIYITCDDGNLVSLKAMGNSRPVGKYTYINDYYTLPPSVAIDSVCVIHFKNTYHVNPIRNITKDWYSEPFTVKAESVSN